MKTERIENGAVDTSPKGDAIKKEPFVEPKLAFVTPRLEKQGKVEEITAGFFGSFSP